MGEAAEILGITAEAIRSRVKRGTLRSTKEGGTVYVLLEASKNHGFKTDDQTTPEHDRTDAQTSPEPNRTGDQVRLVEALEDQVGYLRSQLAEEREARRRADMLLARLTEANATLAGQVRELTSPERPPYGPESGEELAQGVEEDLEPHTDAQETTETARRPWWLRWIGG